MFHLIGHSLGAHAVGEAGAAVTAGRIPRITGTINFVDYRTLVRDVSTQVWTLPVHCLQSAAAQLVSTKGTRTSLISYTRTAGICLMASYPSCRQWVTLTFIRTEDAFSLAAPRTTSRPRVTSSKAALWSGELTAWPVHGRSACDHSRAIAYFAESINSKRGFRAVQCNTEEEFFAGFCAYNDAVFMGDPTPAT